MDFIKLISLEDEEFENKIYSLIKKNRKKIGRTSREVNVQELFAYYNKEEKKYESSIPLNNSIKIIIPNNKIYYKAYLKTKKPKKILNLEEKNKVYYKEAYSEMLPLINKYKIQDNYNEYLEKFINEYEDSFNNMSIEEIVFKDKEYSLKSFYSFFDDKEINRYALIESYIFLISNVYENPLKTLEFSLNKIYKESEANAIIERFLKLNEDIIKYSFV